MSNTGYGTDEIATGLGSWAHFLDWLTINSGIGYSRLDKLTRIPFYRLTQKQSGDNV